MILDIITAALIVIPMGIGMARGFLYVAVRLLGWLGALAGGFYAAPHVKEWLAHGPVGEYIHNTLTAQFAGTTDGVTQATEGLPMILGGAIDGAVQNTVDMIVAAMENVILTVLGFLMVALAIRLILILVIRPISKRKKKSKSPVSILNKTAGLAIGMIEGFLLAFLFLAALVPVMHGGSPETAAQITEALKYSYLAGPLYDGNLLLAMFGRY